jgi:addiction module HigA family antidote
VLGRTTPHATSGDLYGAACITTDAEAFCISFVIAWACLVALRPCLTSGSRSLKTGRFIPNRGGAAPRGLPRTRIERIAAETTGITADTALRLGKALGTSTQLWMNLQNRYDVEIAKREIGKKLDKIEPIIGHAAA